MKPNDALGELVKKWREVWIMTESYEQAVEKRVKQGCADQLEKVREGKMLIDLADFNQILEVFKPVNHSDLCDKNPYLDNSPACNCGFDFKRGVWKKLVQKYPSLQPTKKILLYDAQEASKDLDRFWEKVKDQKDAKIKMSKFRYQVLLTLSKAGKPIPLHL